MLFTADDSDIPTSSDYTVLECRAFSKLIMAEPQIYINFSTEYEAADGANVRQQEMQYKYSQQ